MWHKRLVYCEAVKVREKWQRWEIAFAAVVFAAGLFLRLRLALLTYLNPDEALAALSASGSWSEVLRESLRIAHPPLMQMVTHAVSLVSRSELALRMVPVLSGSLFPVVMALWLRRIAGRASALAALLLLTMAPHLITLSAQLRSYTPALLLLSLSLVALEKAADFLRWMAVYSVLLWLVIAADYSMAYFVAAASLYALFQLAGASRIVRVMWLTGQIVAAGIYGLLYEIQVRGLQDAGMRKVVTEGYLQGGFPQPGTDVLFPMAAVMKQFAYLMASIPLGAVALAAFAVSVYWLYKDRRGDLLVLTLTPFVAALAAAYLRLFPLGRTRHTIVLGVFAATGIAILWEHLPRRALSPVLWICLGLTPLWLWAAGDDQQDIASFRNRKQQMEDCLAYMQSRIPPGSVIFTEDETLLMLSYYLDGKALPRQPGRGGFSEAQLSGRWKVVTRDYGYRTKAEYLDALSAFRANYGAPFWVMDGGWDVVSGPADPAQPFTQAIRLTQVY